MSIAPDRLYHMGGVPVGETINPTFGKIWWVDAANGAAAGPGTTPDTAFNTIQLAVTAQIAGTSSLGDVIYVMPGTYAESVTGAMTKVQIIGASCSGIPGAAVIAPTTSNAYAGDMTNAAFRNMAFKQPTSSKLANVATGEMEYSAIDNCLFLGTDTTDLTVGLRIGEETSTAWEHMEYSSITNCNFASSASRVWGLDYGIVFGSAEATTDSDTRQFLYSVIANNSIHAQFVGILLQTDETNCNGGVIARNWVGSEQLEEGCVDHGIQSKSGNMLCKVLDNRVVSLGAPISGFATSNVLNNVVSQEGVVDLDGWFE